MPACLLRPRLFSDVFHTECVCKTKQSRLVCQLPCQHTPDERQKTCCAVALRPEAGHAGERRCMSMHRCACGASAAAPPGPQPVAAAPAWRAVPCAGCRPRACSLASPGASPLRQPRGCSARCSAVSLAAARRPAARGRRLCCQAGPRGLSGPAQVLVGAAGLVSADVRAHLIFCLAGVAPSRSPVSKALAPLVLQAVRLERSR